ncbi:MAG: NRDE family protein [Desulfobacteraceae bacterium]|nr:NRDE family protein [Desulfobacteraceae bacterium]MBC2754037.1 NRDE family protein [Desulfobacteraceae bacterium]
MCLIAIATQNHPLYPLIIAANRDEFYHRPTAPLSFWEDQPNILAGRDLQQNGTWLGITKTGRIAAITNFREPAAMDPHAPSRGLLVSNFLASDHHPEDYLQAIKNSGKTYNGFNLVVGDMHQLWWYSNKKNDIVKIKPGIHVISNHLMDTPWPKTQKIKSGIQDICNRNNAIDPEDIFQVLADKNRPPDDKLPDTGVGLEWERILSSVFVFSDIYGTRSSAVILAEPSGQMTFAERTFKPQKNAPTIEETREFNIKVPV